MAKQVGMKLNLQKTYCATYKAVKATGLKATKIIGQRKAFHRKRIPEFSRARKETVDIDIHVTSRNGDRKFM